MGTAYGRLLSRYVDVPHCWETAGDRFAKFVEKHRFISGLTELSEATQQLHLGMESYWSWYEARQQKRLTRRRARRPL